MPAIKRFPNIARNTTKPSNGEWLFNEATTATTVPNINPFIKPTSTSFLIVPITLESGKVFKEILRMVTASA